MAEFLRYNEFIVDLRNSAFLRFKRGWIAMMERGLRGKVAALGAAVVFMCRRQSAGKQPAGILLLLCLYRQLVSVRYRLGELRYM